MNGSDALPASTVNKITWSRYVTLDSPISSPVLAGGASNPFMLPPCIIHATQQVKYTSADVGDFLTYIRLY